MIELHTAKIERIATQLLAGMLANPEIYRLYPRVNKMYRLHPTLNKEYGSRQQEEELIIRAIAMAETLVTKVQTQIKHRDYSHFPPNMPKSEAIAPS